MRTSRAQAPHQSHNYNLTTRLIAIELRRTWDRTYRNGSSAMRTSIALATLVLLGATAPVESHQGSLLTRFIDRTHRLLPRRPSTTPKAETATAERLREEALNQILAADLTDDHWTPGSLESLASGVTDHNRDDYDIITDQDRPPTKIQ